MILCVAFRGDSVQASLQIHLWEIVIRMCFEALREVKEHW